MEGVWLWRISGGFSQGIIGLNMSGQPIIKKDNLSNKVGRFYKNVGFYLEGVWLLRISGSYSQEMMGLNYLAEMTSEELSGIIIR